MNDSRWQRIEEVFHHAIEVPPANRAAFLSTACAGDDQLRREVETLLENDDPGDDMVGAAVHEAVEQLPAESAAAVEQFIGKHIGPYQITELIGKGGMGMVFKALDTQLNRPVAIKALPLDRHTDPESRRRFVQEAKATSALNHPNIVTVHSITQEGGTDFIIMEYLSGQTLDRAIPAKGLPVKTAVKYAIEIADALAAAHAAGIVHRDVKPSNVMVTAEGRLKVLDFGLAKLGESALGASAGTNPTETKAGLVFGTASYMSPEQAQGKRADPRSDIFAFGAVLYEMVTGRRAFAGGDVITILAAVLHDSTPSVCTAATGAPPELEWIIARCLKKDPDRRIRHMVEVKLALQEVLERVESPSTALAPSRSRRRYWLAPALIALAAIGLASAAWFGNRIFHQRPITFQRMTFRRGDVLSARFAPGGSVVYAAAWDGGPLTLFSAQPGAREARDLGLPPANILSVSPLSDLAILIGSRDPNTNGTLASVPLSGGAPREILENVSSADWHLDGKALAVVRSTGGHHRVESPVGTVLYETDSLRAPVYLHMSPSSGALAFFDVSEVGDYSVNVVAAPRPRQVLSRGWRTVAGLGWSPSGKEIWFSGGRPGDAPALYAVDLAGRERMLTQIPGWGVLHDVARDGKLLLANVDSRIGLQCLAPGAREERDLSWLDASHVFEISDDGKWILFGELSSGEGRNPAIYLRRTDGTPAVRLAYCIRPSLARDGKSVACVRQDGPNSQLMVVPTGAGEAKALPTPGIRPESAEWFPDGKQILFTGIETGSAPKTYILDLASGKARPVTQAGIRASRISPDGRTAVLVQAGKLYVRSLESGGDTPVCTVEPGDAVIRWSGDGRYLFFQHNDPENRSAAVMRVDARTGQKEVWRKVRTPDATASFFSTIRLSADGKAYAFSFQRDLATLYIVNGVK